VSAIGRLVRFKLRKRPHDVDASLRHIVRRAFDEVPFYADLYARAGVECRDVVSVDDLVRLPIARRADLLACGDARHLRRGADPQSLARRSTTGTTGEPLCVFSDRPEALFRKASLLDSFRRNADLRFPLAIADVGVEEGKSGRDISQRLGLVRIDRILRTMPIAEQALEMARLSPDIVEGRPSSLWALAEEANRQGLRFPRPRLVVSFAETLYPHARAVLEQIFGCRVADYYNCEEVGNVAWECPEHVGRMHVNQATTVLEVVDNDGLPLPAPGVGRILLTNLYNCTMPFIRYEIGDRAARIEEEVCTCGSRGGSIRLVEGRDEDFFVLPDGREISPREAYEAIVGVLKGRTFGNEIYSAIRRFQIVQESRESIVVRVVPGPAYDHHLWDGVAASARRLHPAVRVRIDEVDALELAPAGKFKQVTSQVDRPRRLELRRSGGA
jgi:phenylacetate-CoA ligase